MKYILSFLLTCILLTLSCHTAPDRPDLVKALSIPEDWTATQVSERSVTHHWWFSFHSTEMVELVQEAFEHNHNLKAAAHRVEQSMAHARIAGAELYPALNLTGSGARNKQSFIGLPIPGADNSVLTTYATSYDLSGGISWEIDLWGRIRAGKRAAGAELLAAEEEYHAARLSLAARTLKAWFRLIETKQQWDFESATAENYQETAEIVRTRYESGIRSSLDLRLALNNQADAQRRVTEAQMQHQMARRQLEVLLGRYPSAQIGYPIDLPILPSPAPVGIPADILSRRPDVRAAELRLEAADRRIWEAKALLLPRISLTANTGTRSNEMENLLDPDFSVWSLAGNAAQPLFQGGRILAGVKRAQARAEEAHELYVQTLLQAFEEVENALENESLLAEMEGHASEASHQANAALRLSQDRYRKGLVEFISVLEAQRRSVSAERLLIQIRRSRLDNRIDLHLALGGDYSDETLVSRNHSEDLDSRPEPETEISFSHH